jgi:hypothetical protein
MAGSAMALILTVPSFVHVDSSDLLDYPELNTCKSMSLLLVLPVHGFRLALIENYA